MTVRSIGVLALSVASLLAACAQQSGVTTAIPNGGRGASDVARSVATTAPTADPIPGKITADTAAVAAQYGVPGAAVDFVYHGKSYTHYYGEQDESTKVAVSAETAFELGSVTKAFTALDVMLALLYPSIDESVDPKTTYTGGKYTTEPLSDGSLAAYRVPAPSKTDANGNPCPTLAAPTPLPAAGYSATFKAMRLRDLADHASTLPDQPPNPYGSGTLPVYLRPCYPAQMLVNYVESYTSPKGETVGKYYDYSDIGYGILGDWIAGFLGTDYFTLTYDLVLSPLSMHQTLDVSRSGEYGSNYATGYNQNGEATAEWPVNAWPGGGTLRSKGGDMLLFLKAALLQSSNAQFNNAMKQAETAPTGVMVNNGTTYTQALAWATGPINGETVTFKDGETGGFTAWIGLVAPGTANAVGIVVMTNKVASSTSVAPATAIAEKVLKDVGP